MDGSMYKKIKKQNGEKFAQALRNFHNGILEVPNIDIILRHAGRDARPLLPYLMSLLATNDDTPASAPSADPFVLLEQAGYKAFYADSLEKQNSIKDFFAKGELLCTFNDKARYRNYHILHAIKKDVDHIKREDFKGQEERQDAYGTSVISIQILKKSGFISIKNRYNHTVSGCDNTFGSNPDNIIKGLTNALKNHFNVEFSATATLPEEGYVLMGKQVFKYHTEYRNIYYGDQAWAEKGKIHAVDRSVNALFNLSLFGNKTKTLKNIDPSDQDSFAADFNRCYGGNPALAVNKNGDLTLNGEVLIGTKKSQIKTLYLPGFKSMSEHCLSHAEGLERFEAPDLTSMSDHSLFIAPDLTHFEAPALKSMGRECLVYTDALTSFKAPNARQKLLSWARKANLMPRQGL